MSHTQALILYFFPLIETVEKVNKLVSFGGFATKRHFDWAEWVKCKAIRVRQMGAYYKYVAEAESRKQRRNLPAMQQFLIEIWYAISRGKRVSNAPDFLIISPCDKRHSDDLEGK